MALYGLPEKLIETLVTLPFKCLPRNSVARARKPLQLEVMNFIRGWKCYFRIFLTPEFSFTPASNVREFQVK